MKKIVSLLLCIFLFLICTTKATAEEIKYGNLVTDETTIEEDYELLGLSIDDYYKPSYNYSKFYVVGMSEAYIDDTSYDIQTYFYLYSPIRYYKDVEDYNDAVATTTLTFELKNADILSNIHGQLLDYDVNHLLYKIKGFTYKYTDSAEISITNISHSSVRGLSIKSNSNFKATANHSKINGFNVELYFNSTIIIDDIEVVSLQIEPQNSIFDYIFSGELFEDIFNGGVNNSTLQLYFYNFNFPDHIKPDSIEFAYFEVTKEFWQRQYKLYGCDFTEVYDKIIETKSLSYELYPKDFTFDIGNKVEEINFPRFYLGDRYKDKQFGDLKFEKLDAAKFDRDCSIFLDYNYEIEYSRNEMVDIHKDDTKYIDYTKLKDVELLELWYEKDGITYKCQVVSKPTDSEPINPEYPKKETIWDKIKEIIIKIVDWILLNIFQTDPNAFPEIAKLAIGFGLGLVALVLTIVLLPYIIKLLIFIIQIPIKLFIWIIQRPFEFFKE